MLCDALGFTDLCQYLLEDSYAERIVARHRNPMMDWGVANEDYVASHLIDLTIAPVLTKMADYRSPLTARGSFTRP
jgi:hypothetical protein